MFKIQKRIVYAIEAVVDISLNSGSTPVQNISIAKRQGIPKRYLEQTLQELVKNKINLDQTRIYSSGMSNGGFMSYHLACNLSNQIAAIASVTGSMTPETFANCNQTHATPILQIHGLLDYTVPYNGLSYMESIPKVMEYWSEYNSCSSEPDETNIENISEGYVINIQEYKNCLNDVNVKLYLHSSMGHTWPRISNYGISASSEVWNFVSQYNLYGKIN